MRESSLARNVIRMFKTNDPFDICESLEITVVFINLAGTKGFYQNVEGGDIIYINNCLSYHEQRFVCAHELAHCLLDDQKNAIFLSSSTYQVGGKFERTADRFAALLLWPDDDELLEYAGYTFEQLSALLGMPTELVSWRFTAILKNNAGRFYRKKPFTPPSIGESPSRYL